MWKAHPKASGIRKQVRLLRSFVDSSLAEFFGEEESQLLDIAVEASWANVNPLCGLPTLTLKGSSGGNNATSQLPCQINLMDPRPSAPMASVPAEVRDAMDFGIDWTLSLWPGTLLIFPSWLGHWVPPNAAPNQRITISFNAGVTQARPAEEGRLSPALTFLGS
ncbi:hypothetical protein AK812_SmicGene25574 [Symbiodinium microadriaticum]|uniref:Uncharacterized protein n=1 Tax=Symbiodinium microadriaticum TaxID=2951 RepID=A0A1Q9DBL3_SYMMI|nr:hypothetical protein AK812_SmicGene25574 [Symbiodinium microadriaticum]